MRRSHQNQFHQRKSPPTRHSTQPKEVKQSVIVSNGCIERILHPTDDRMCVFRYRRDRRPVESQWLGTIPEDAMQTWDLSVRPWYLNVKRFLYLHRVRLEDSIAYMTSHCFRVRGQQYMHEFGRHLYVNSDGILCVMEIWQEYRANKRVLHSDEHYINDVLPKLRIELDWGALYCGGNCFNGANYRRLTTLSIVPKKNRLMTCQWPSRWWYKYGREDQSRYYEWETAEALWDDCAVDNYTYEAGGRFRLREPWMIVKSEPHFGIYVDNKAKLIVRDVIKCGVDYDYNHTLIQSGCFVVIQGGCRLTFMDNTQKVYELKELYRNAPNHPIIILTAVPSLGESLCWGLSILPERQANTEIRRSKGPIIDSIINVPLLGMNDRRMRVLEWDLVFGAVNHNQHTFDYGQFVREDTAFPVDHQLMSAEFIADEPLEYPRIPKEYIEQ